MTDDTKLRELATQYNKLMELTGRRNLLIAEMVRGCVQQLKSPDSRKRAEAIRGLEQLADLLEGKTT